MEDGVRGHVVQVQPIVEHHPAHEWVQRETHASYEVGNEYYPQPSIGGRHSLVGAGSMGADVGGEVSRSAQLQDGAICHDGTTPMPFEGIGMAG